MVVKVVMVVMAVGMVVEEREVRGVAMEVMVAMEVVGVAMEVMVAMEVVEVVGREIVGVAMEKVGSSGCRSHSNRFRSCTRDILRLAHRRHNRRPHNIYTRYCKRLQDSIASIPSSTNA